MDSRPMASIAIPIFNGERFLGEAIESVLGQSFESLELLLIDDGSTDASLEIARSYSDPRVRVLAMESNEGIPRTQSLALSQAQGRYFGILDQDDVALPDRLTEQIRFLESEKSIVAVGAWYQTIDQSGRLRGGVTRRPTDPDEIACQLLFQSVMHQPVVTGRTEILRRFGYRDRYPVCCDYDLWTRLAAEHRLANLPLVLAHYRQGAHQTTKTASTRLIESTMAIQRELLIRLGATPSDDDLARHFGIPRKKRFGLRFDVDSTYLDWLSGWLATLEAANRQRGVYEIETFGRVLEERWRAVLGRAFRRGRFSSALRHRLRGRTRLNFESSASR